MRFGTRGSPEAAYWTDRGVLLDPGGGPMLELQWLGARPVVASGRDRGAGNFSAYFGREPERWHTGESTWRAVAYPALYPGVEVRYALGPEHLELSLSAAPGADLRASRFRVKGATSLSVTAEGELSIRAGTRRVLQRRPRAFQRTPEGERPVRCGWSVGEDGTVGFRLGAYDRRWALEIDPTIAWSRDVGGSMYDFVSGVAADAAGDLWVVGETESPDFPGQRIGQPTGLTNAFAVRLDVTGQLFTSVVIGGSTGAEASAVAVDLQGAAYLTGQAGPDFPVTSGSWMSDAGVTGVNMVNAFVTKLGPQGQLSYSTFYGVGTEDGNGIAVDSNGQAILVGTTLAPNLPLLNPAQPNAGGNGLSDVFVVKLDRTGATLVFGTYLGGSNQEHAEGVAVDAQDNIYVTGWTQSVDFPTLAPFQSSLRGGSTTNSFLSSYTPLGAVRFSTFLGGGGDYATGISVSANGEATVVGGTLSPNFPLQNAAQPNNAASNNGMATNGFVARFQADAQGLLFSTYLGGSTSDQAQAVTGLGPDVVVASAVFSPDFPRVGPQLPAVDGGTEWVGLTRFLADGGRVSSVVFGGGVSELPRALTSRGGDVFVGGLTDSPALPNQLDGGGYQGASDGFVVAVTYSDAGLATIDAGRPDAGVDAGTRQDAGGLDGGDAGGRDAGAADAGQLISALGCDSSGSLPVAGWLLPWLALAWRPRRGTRRASSGRSTRPR